MGDRYKKLRKKIRRKRGKERMCLSKKRYETREEAFQEGQGSYECKHCGGWHRTGQRTQFIVQLVNGHLPK